MAPVETLPADKDQSFSDWARQENAKERNGDDLSPAEPASPPSAGGQSPAAAENAAADAETPAEPAEKEPAERDATGKFVKKDSVQQRIDKAVKAQREAERRAAEFESRLVELESRSAAGQQAPELGSTPAPIPVAGDGRPRLEANNPETGKPWESYEQYVEAVADWKAGQRLQIWQQQMSAAQAEAEQAERVAGMLEAGSAKYADFTDVTSSEAAYSIPWPPHVQAAVESAENPEDILYYFGQHPDEARALVAQDPFKALLQIGSLSHRLAAASGSARSVPTPSRAKPPIKPVGAAPVAPADSPPGDNASFAEHRRYYDRLEREARARR